MKRRMFTLNGSVAGFFPCEHVFAIAWEHSHLANWEETCAELLGVVAIPMMSAAVSGAGEIPRTFATQYRHTQVQQALISHRFGSCGCDHLLVRVSVGAGCTVRQWGTGVSPVPPQVHQWYKQRLEKHLLEVY